MIKIQSKSIIQNQQYITMISIFQTLSMIFLALFPSLLYSLQSNYQLNLLQTPRSLNWNKNGCITKLKKITDNALQCSMAGFVGVQMAVAHAQSILIINQGYSNDIDLSQKFMLDCLFRADPCNSSTYSYLFLQSALQNSISGIPKQSLYRSCSSETLKFTDGVLYYYNLDDHQIQSLLQYGTLLVGVAINQWTVYTGGIFQCKKSELDYYSLLVGYDQYSWILINKYGFDWDSQQGFIRISKKQGKNCGIGKYSIKFQSHPCPTGCKKCSYEEYNNKFQMVCTQCFDSSAILSETGCTCPQGKYFNNNFQCENCKIPYCNQCKLSNNLQCQQCMNQLQFKDGFCRCPNGKIPTLKGQCQQCNVIGCLACIDDNPDQCSKCEYSNAKLKNGECLCSSGFITNSTTGICTQDTTYCPYEGCSKCLNNQCTKCIDPIMRVKDGRCKFDIQYIYDSDQEGYTIRCQVLGCSKCSKTNNELCLKCLDQISILSSDNKSCLCPSSQMIFNDNEKCVSNIQKIQGCVQVNTFDNSICSKCSQQFILVSGTCRYLQMPFQPGCIDHQNTQNKICLKCISSMLLVQQKCYCPIQSQILDQNYKCVTCFAAHCEICSSNNPYKCAVCKEEYTRDSLAICQNSSKCNIVGCRTCKSGNLEFCQQCIDPKAYIDNGVCICQTDQYFINTYGICMLKQHQLDYVQYYQKQRKSLSILNWEQNGLISRPKDRGMSSSIKLDYVFTIAAYLESLQIMQNLEKKANDVDISEQHIISCLYDPQQSDSFAEYFAQFFQQDGKQYFAYQSQIPYGNFQGSCQVNRHQLDIQFIVTYRNYNTQQIQNILHNGPIMVEISSQFNPETYAADQVLSCTQSQNQGFPNHSGLLIGYTKDYWIIKYNLGSDWGNQGYLYLNKVAENSCGLKSGGTRFLRDKRYRNCENIQGCLLCSYQQTQCYLCTQNSILSDDGTRCLCSNKFSMSTEGYCQYCQVLGCQSCNSQNSKQCIICDDGFSKDQLNQCVCNNINQKPNKNGICQQCDIQNCASCLPGNPLKCSRCIDNFSFLSDDGQCGCLPPMNLNQNGKCSLCLVTKCAQCNTQDPNKCQICEKGFNNIDNICECSNPEEYINSGVCQQCSIQRCEKCIQNGQCQSCSLSLVPDNTGEQCVLCQINKCRYCSNFNQCSMCVDQFSSVVLQGQCQCIYSLRGHNFNEIDLCYECRAQYCSVCAEGYQTLCRSCSEQNMQVNNGICQCKQGYTLNSDNQCQKCSIENCNYCQNGKSNICQQCNSLQLYIFDGQCVKHCQENSSEAYCQQQQQTIQVGVIVGITVGVVFVAAIITIALCINKRRRQKYSKQKEQPIKSGQNILKQNEEQSIGAPPPYIDNQNREELSNKMKHKIDPILIAEYLEKNRKYEQQKKQIRNRNRSLKSLRNRSSKSLKSQNSLNSQGPKKKEQKNITKLQDNQLQRDIEQPKFTDKNQSISALNNASNKVVKNNKHIIL